MIVPEPGSLWLDLRSFGSELNTAPGSEIG